MSDCAHPDCGHNSIFHKSWGPCSAKKCPCLKFEPPGELVRHPESACDDHRLTGPSPCAECLCHEVDRLCHES